MIQHCFSTGDATLRKVEDHRVLLVFACPECGLAATMHPEVIAEAGAPVCERCDDDMDYSHVCVATRAPETFAELLEAADGCEVGEDNDGQLVIYTGLREDESGRLWRLE